MKVFVSQLMRGKTTEQILKERHEFLSRLYMRYPDAEVLPTIDNTMHVPVYKLGTAIQMLSEADAIVFMPGWEEGRGTLIEREIAIKYNIPILEIPKED